MQAIENAAQVYQEILESINNSSSTPVLPQPTESFRTEGEILPLQANQVSRFYDEIRFEIQESVEYPNDLRGQGLSDKVVVEFQLNPDGTLRSIDVKNRQRDIQPSFEVGALNAVRRAVEFFPPIPKEIDPDYVVFKVPIIFEDA